MKRRKNFLFSGTKRFEVRIYPYGMEGYENQGEQNIKRKKFSTMEQACRWFDANTDYPLVELVDLEKDHLVASGGTGHKFNPKKRKRKRKTKTEVSRRDVYAEMAKARKTTRGHKRKDRKRSVARGSSRKPKHRVRLNPYDKPNKNKGAFDTNVSKRKNKLLGLYRGFYNALEEQNIDIDDLPSFDTMRAAAEEAAIAIESTRFPELRGQSYETISPGKAAKEALGLDEDGVFAEYATKGNRFFKAQLKELASAIKKNQAEVKKLRAKTSTEVSTAKEDAELAKVEREIQARLQPVEAQRDQEASMREREFASEVLDDEEPLTPEQQEAERKRKRSLSRTKRISRYEDHVLDTRRSDVSPPLKVLADARQDVLLYALKDGTTQVWSKGAITETFLPSKKTSSVTIAHRYANWWRGLDERGKIREKAKKSRLRSRVLLAVEGRKGVKVIEPSIAQEIGQVQRDVIGTHGLPSLDDYELKGPRANPKAGETNVFFFLGHEYDPKKRAYKSTKSLFAKKTTRFGLGPTYKISIARAKSPRGFGTSNLESLDNVFAGFTETDWKYLLPKKAGKVRPASQKAAKKIKERKEFGQKLKAHSGWNPFWNDLSYIEGNHRTYVGSRDREIPRSRARAMERKGLVYISGRAGNETVSLTPKGYDRFQRGQEEWDRMFLNNPRRRRNDKMTYTDAELLDYLKTAKSGITVMELAYSFGGTSSSHTARLRKLVKAGKIKTRKVGKTTRYYRANPRSRKKESKRAFVERVWSERAPRLPSHSYGPRRGLEGPFQFRSGKVLYYDPREGAYYDPDSDMYLSDSEAEAFIMNPRRRKNSSGLKFQIDGHGADYPFRFKKGKIGKVGRLELSVIPINTFYPLLADSGPSVREMNAYILVVRADGSGKDVPYATRMKVLKAAQQAVADYTGLPI